MPRRLPVATDKRFRKSSVRADMGPQERWQHSGRTLMLTETRGQVAARSTEESVLDILVLRNVLAPRQRDAALRLKEDYLGAGIAASVSSRYAALLNKGDKTFRERERTAAEEAAYRRWRNALQRLEPGFRNVVIATACQEMLPPLRDVLRLQKGLAALVAWYRL